MLLSSAYTISTSGNLQILLLSAQERVHHIWLYDLLRCIY